MAIRNYVGARYVPKFADPVEWQANTSYEAMVIVTYNNASYTSKVPVPPTVGNPAENSKYWALTGNYNAQVEEYRQETETVRNNLSAEITARENADTTITNTITQNQQATQENINSINKFNAQSNTIKNRKFLLIGDSYLEGDYFWTTTKVTTWGPRLASILGLTSDQYVISAKSGAGFNATAQDTNINFEYLLVNAPVTNKKEITDIIVAGGYNDRTNTMTAISSFVNKASELYQNAQVWIGYIAGRINGPANLNIGYNYYKEGTTKNNANWLGDVYLCLINSVTDVFSDPGTAGGDFHPNNQGQQLIAEAIAQKIKGGEYDLYLKRIATITADNGSGFFKFTQYVYNNQLFMYHYVGNGTSMLNFGPTITLSENEVSIGTVTGSIVTETPYITVPIVIRTSGGPFTNSNAEIRIHNGKLMAKLKYVTDNAWTSIANIDSIQFSNISATMPLSLEYELY